jgi:hypothetical protein
VSRAARISTTIALAIGLALFVLGAVYAWGASLGVGFTYLDKEPPYQVQAYLKLAHVIFYGSVAGALSQIVGLVLVWGRKWRAAAPNNALESDTYSAPLHAPSSAPQRER